MAAGRDAYNDDVGGEEGNRHEGILGEDEGKQGRHHSRTDRADEPF